MTSSTPPGPATITKAVAVAARGGTKAHMRRLSALFTDVGVSVTVVQSAADAAAHLLMDTTDTTRLVLVEAEDNPENLDAAVEELVETMTSLLATLPYAALVAITRKPPVKLIIEAFRSGAVDCIDLAAEPHDSLALSLRRLATRLHSRRVERERVERMRGMVEDFLRDLIKTERRSIDLERQLEIIEHGRVELTTDLDSDREPVVIIVEDDREVADLLVDELEEQNVTTYAYINGEDAVKGVRGLVNKGDAIDLALVDAMLPGMGGLETIALMREHRSRLGAFLMTGYDNNNLAKRAADIGVVGYVLKPFDDIPGLVNRIKEQALHFRDQGRDQHYLECIKQRHEQVLTAYRTLTAELDQLG